MVAQESLRAESARERAEDALIERWLAPNPHKPSEMVLAAYGVPVWALVGYARGVDDDIEEVARAYEVPSEAVRAALAYYRRNPLQIDAKLAANAAWHTA